MLSILFGDIRARMVIQIKKCMFALIKLLKRKWSGVLFYNTCLSRSTLWRNRYAYLSEEQDRNLFWGLAIFWLNSSKMCPWHSSGMDLVRGMSLSLAMSTFNRDRSLSGSLWNKAQVSRWSSEGTCSTNCLNQKYHLLSLARRIQVAPISMLNQLARSTDVTKSTIKRVLDNHQFFIELNNN